MLIVADAMSLHVKEKWRANIVQKRTDQMNICKTDAHKYKQACDIRLFTRRDQSGAAQARYIKGLEDVSVCYPKGGPCVLHETELVWGPEDLQAQLELSAI